MRLPDDSFDVRFEAKDAPVSILSDRDALEQVLINITDNALKYAREGRDLTVELENTADEIRIHIMDRGPGVPRQHQDRIFEKFHRVDDSLTAEQGGSGLGLSIADRLIRGLGGRLAYRDREGGGAVFTLHLPAQAEESTT